jgi:hypothetical protein
LGFFLHPSDVAVSLLQYFFLDACLRGHDEFCVIAAQAAIQTFP